MQRELILILGGARSGKSTFAQRIAMEKATDVLFVATAEARDEEMAERIDRHRAERPAHWNTVEAPRAVADALVDTGVPVVVLDCVTLWVSNLLLTESTTLDDALAELDALLEWRRSHAGCLIVVSNEVGLGIVPADPVTRAYREWLGRFNQRLAQEADVVYWTVAGLALDLKALGAVSVVNG